MNKEVAKAHSRLPIGSQKSAGEIAFLNYCESRGLEIREGEAFPAYEDLKSSLKASLRPLGLGTALKRMLF